MALLYLVRHARPQMTGDAPARWPLSRYGQRQASILARQDLWCEVEHIFSSPEPKALHTVEPAACRWSIPLEIVDCLHELRRPHLVSDYGQAVARLLADRQASIAGMEPAAQAAERIIRCLKALVAARPDRTLAAVSHGLVLTLFLARLENRWPALAEWRAVPFAGLAVVETTPWRLVKGWVSICEAS